MVTVQAHLPPAAGTMDVDEFMAFLETRPDGERWDLIEGVAVMMAPASYAHQRITRNLCELLNNAFAARQLDLFAYFDSGVRSPGVRNFQPQPDVVVVPGVAGYELYSEQFQLAGEVLSPTNTQAEIELKLRRYCEAPENLYAVVIEPREFHVEIYARAQGWEPNILTKADDPIEMAEFGLRCQVVDLYRGTPLDPQRKQRGWDAARPPCHMLPNGMTVRVDETTAHEPDALIYCGPELASSAIDLPNTKAVVEVISPSTCHIDAQIKFAGYFRLPSVAHYLVINPDKPLILHHARNADGTVLTRIVNEGTLALDPPGIEIAVADTYSAT